MGYEVVYIGGSVNSRPLDQTDLKERRRCNLGGGGEPTFEGGADRWALGTRRPAGGAGRPHMAAPRGLLRWVAFWCVLDPSQVVYIMDKRDVI